MPDSSTAFPGNILLARLDAGDRALLDSYLEPVSLQVRDVLVHADHPVSHVYFLENGLASVVSSTQDGTRLEVGIFGRDGLSAPFLLLGVDRTPHETFVQAPGSALRLEAEAFVAALGRSPRLRETLLKYVQALNIQTAHTAVANGRFTIEERLARWLLMCHDRSDGNALPLTHEFLSMMLAVRRAGVTVAVQTLEAAGLIRGERGLITIVNRAGLVDIADGSYGVPEAEYARLIAPLRREPA